MARTCCHGPLRAGDPTDNAREFVAWLKQATAPDLLPRLRFAVFGLGNRQYEHFNSQGKLVDERLGALGGERLVPLGLGDDDGTMEDDYAAWKERLWPVLASAAGAATAATSAAATNSELCAPTLVWALVPLPVPASAAKAAEATARASQSDRRGSVDLGSRHFFTAHPARVTANRELRREVLEPGDSTRHVELDLGGVSYSTADNLYVLPENDAPTVEAVARWLGYDLNEWFTLEPAAAAAGAADSTPAAPLAVPPFPVPCSVRDALTYYCDLHGAPRKEFVAELAYFATAADERAAMVSLAHRSGKAKWSEIIAVPQRSVAELLQLFPSLRVPLGAFVELAPRLMPRAYTIASSALVYPASVHVCSRVVDAPKPGGDATRRLRGVCSTLLAQVAPGAMLRVYVRPSTFRLPANPAVPIILVGPGERGCAGASNGFVFSRTLAGGPPTGTGIAPMRAFLQERSLQRSRGAAVGETVLFFGCQ